MKKRKKTVNETAAAVNPYVYTEGEEFKVLEDPLLPPVKEFKRFYRVFFHRKIVVFGMIVVILIIFASLFANVISPYDPLKTDYFNTLAKPSLEHPLGTDTLGRDLLCRIFYGGRIALLVGIVSVFLSAAVGTLIGLVAGFAEGPVQTVIMRLTDVIMSVPNLILQLLISTALGNGTIAVVVAISITLFPGYIRLIAGQVMSYKQNDYVKAAQSMGASRWHIMIKHLLPNCISPLIVQMTMMMGVAILSEASLSFLGLGISPPTPAWGSMCYDGYQYLLTNPLLSIAPGLIIMLLVFSFNMVGDGLRDALDPHLRGTLS